MAEICRTVTVIRVFLQEQGDTDFQSGSRKQIDVTMQLFTLPVLVISTLL